MSIQRKKSLLSHLKRNRTAGKVKKVSLQVRKTKLNVYLFFAAAGGGGGVGFSDGMGINIVVRT